MDPKPERAPPRPVASRALLHGSVVQVVGKALVLGFQLLTFALMTRLLGLGGFGDLSAGLAMTGAFEAIAEFGLTSTLVLRFSESDDARGLMLSGVIATAATSVGGLAVAVPAVLVLFPSGAQEAFWLLIPSSLVTLLGASLSAYWQHQLAFGRLLRANATGQLISAALVGVALELGRQWSEPGRLLAVGIALALAACATVGMLLPRALVVHAPQPRAVRWREARAVMSGALPLGIAGSLSLLHVRADQIILATMGYRNGLADYAVGYQVLQGIVIGVGSIGVVGFALMARSRGTERALQCRRSITILCSIGVIAAFGMALFAPLAVAVLGGRSFSGAIRVCRLLAPVVVISLANTMAGRALIVEGRARLLGLVAALGLSVNVGLNLLLIPLMGIDGAATATVVSELFGAVLVTLIASRILPSSQPRLLLGATIFGATGSILAMAWLPRWGVYLSLGLAVLTLVATGILSVRAWSPRSAVRTV